MRAFFRRGSFSSPPGSEASTSYASPEDVSYSDGAARRRRAGAGDAVGIQGAPLPTSSAGAAPNENKRSGPLLSFRERSRRRGEAGGREEALPRRAPSSSKSTMPPPSSYVRPQERHDPSDEALAWRLNRVAVAPADDGAPVRIMSVSPRPRGERASSPVPSSGAARPPSRSASRQGALSPTGGSLLASAWEASSPAMRSRDGLPSLSTAHGHNHTSSSYAFEDLVTRSPSRNNSVSYSYSGDSHLRTGISSALSSPTSTPRAPSSSSRAFMTPSTSHRSTESYSSATDASTSQRFPATAGGTVRASAKTPRSVVASSPGSKSPRPRFSPAQSSSGDGLSLAARLNELAVAHGDGLLADEDYRQLRQAVFEGAQGEGALEMPREHRVGGLAAAQKAEPAVEASPPPHLESSQARSMRSTRSSLSNFATLFRKSSVLSMRGRTTSHSQPRSAPPTSAPSSWAGGAQSTDGAGSSSMRSGDSLKLPSSARSDSRSLWQTASTLGRSNSSRTRASQKELEAEVASARYARSVLNAASPTPGSSSGLVRPGSAMRSRSGDSGFSSSNGAAMMLGVENAERSAAELKAEVAIVEEEGKRLLGSFAALEHKAIGQYTLTQAQLQRAYAASQRSVTADTNGARSMLHGTASHPALRKQAGFVAAPPSAPRRSSIGNLLSVTAPPMAQRNSVHSVVSDDGGISASDDGEADAEVSQLAAELASIARRREDVRLRYDERAAFLRTQLRSATIREGLRRS